MAFENNGTTNLNGEVGGFSRALPSPELALFVQVDHDDDPSSRPEVITLENCLLVSTT